MAPPSSERLLSLDAFRGLTIAGMILVNNAGDWDHVFPPLQHATWHGWTLADLIFPFFLFIVGVSMSFSFSRRVRQSHNLKRVYLQVTERTIILFFLGLFLNALYYIPGGFAFSILRIPGVLQRIAVVYFFASFVILKTGPQEQACIATFLLLLYWALMELVVWNKVLWGELPGELMGKWVVTEGPDEGGTIDFYRSGAMRAVVNLQGKTGIVDATIRVEDKKIHATLTNQDTGEKGTRVQTIRVLTRDRLVLEDERGNSIKLRRAE